VAEHPRDALIAQTCTNIYGLIGFSGQPGREAELLAYTTSLAPHYGNDWWFLSQHAFSLGETGQTARAAAMIDQSLALNPRNAHAAHVRAHVYYETGETSAGLDFLDRWLGDYARTGLLHCHLCWHVALWALAQSDADLLWRMIDGSVAPGATLSPPLTVLTDSASILYRAELAGLPVPPERWKAVSDYAKRYFPKPGLGFADLHAALAHAMAGDGEALQAIIRDATGPAADLVRQFAEAYRAIADQKWAEASRHLIPAMVDHARIGGSRAQRDLLEYTLLATLLKQGRDVEARRLLELHRPVQAAAHPIRGI
jgi:tetratricopeptide (TPR) repeat protein